VSKIFLSYRRADSQDVCGRIYDQLRTSFGAQNVFKDVDSIGGGVDFRKSISDAVSQSKVMLVIIGPQWLKVADPAGKPRLYTPDDFVRLEIELALKRQDMKVVPVLVSGATMPSAGQLPASISQLAYQNARTVAGDPDFHHHLERLIKELSQTVPLVAGAAEGGLIGPVSPRPPARARTTSWREKAGSALIIVWLIILFGLVLAIMIPIFIQGLPHLYGGH